MLTQVDAEQPKFEETTLAPPTDLVCVPDQGRFPCLSEGPHPTFLGPIEQGVRLAEPSLDGSNFKTMPA